MNGDFARVTFDPRAGYRRVALQQGRVLLEADFNEQTAIQDHYLRCVIADLKGRCWAVGKAFSLAAAGDDFTIQHGHLYVDGLLCENGYRDAPADACGFFAQPFSVPSDAPDVLPDEPFLIYIECWERYVGALEAPRLREIALGGADTSLRAQTVWQVKIADFATIESQWKHVHQALEARERAAATSHGAIVARKPPAAPAALGDLLKAFASKGNAPLADPVEANDALDALDAAVPLMRAMARSDASADDPCTLAPDAQYRGRENQLYRVEIHDGGSAQTATFKWSRENGSVQFGVMPTIGVDQKSGEAQLTLTSLGRDARSGLKAGDWVELCGEAFELSGEPGAMAQVGGFGPAPLSVTLKLAQPTSFRPDRVSLLRRWDQREPAAHGVSPVTESAEQWLAIERGIAVQFVPGGVYRTGDYWLVPARVASADVDWPHSDGDDPQPLALPRAGIRRQRAALGCGGKRGNDQWKFESFVYGK